MPQKLPSKRNLRNKKNEILLNYFMIKAGNDNIIIKKKLEDLINKYSKLKL
jgi:hypothetical protein